MQPEIWIANRRMDRAAHRHPADLDRLAWYEADHRVRFAARTARTRAERDARIAIIAARVAVMVS